MTQCSADERCRRRLDGDEPLFLPAAKKQTNPSFPPSANQHHTEGMVLLFGMGFQKARFE